MAGGCRGGPGRAGRAPRWRRDAWLAVDTEDSAHLVPEHDVLTDAEVGGEVHPPGRRSISRRPARRSCRRSCAPDRDDDRSGVDAVDTGEGFDQRRLARAVLAHESVHLTLEEAEVDSVERLHSREFDGDPAHLDEGQFFVHRCLSVYPVSGAARSAPPPRSRGDAQYLRSARTALAASAESNARSER